MELNVSSRSHDGHVSVIVVGEIDLYTAPRLHGELTVVIDNAAPGSRVIIDMSGVDFCDSTGMNVLLTSLRQATDRDVGFELTAPQPAVKKILQVTGLDSVFTISPGQATVPGE
ncbi:MAG: STAS domain-containing protein [Nocardiopsaceae bacterium]|nr:STAS domain-containing protein [Nocardiopsaceae bacterium]